MTPHSPEKPDKPQYFYVSHTPPIEKHVLMHSGQQYPIHAHNTCILKQWSFPLQGIYQGKSILKHLYKR